MVEERALDGIASRTAEASGVATTLQKSEPDMIKALDKALGLDHPTDKVKQAAAGGLAAAVSNFSKVLSQGSALEEQKDPLAGQPANSEARSVELVVMRTTGQGEQSLGTLR
ncbi:hypothetical protein AK812_SmicGene39520 [Symbiodinium microadriaticum]|uniref:Uncharacterized protein n=1 Tax=Symbiodinium microadriaticum TaxID=2951 RepID=A0A1Q9CB01_SYMMI|nr:hypothetical protein AK812_SmicGene39520 [Symbiodinium microadriaticum]